MDCNINSFPQFFSKIRFPLIVLVILIHVYSELTQIVAIDSYLISSLMRWISLIFARTAVPFFFLISGYFFFYGIEKFDLACYMGKLKRRVKSLLIPYIAWNTIFLFLYAVKGNEVGYRDFWDGNGGSPICYPFWFIRDLMIVCVSSPIIYFIVKKLKYIAILFIIAWMVIEGGISESFTFFVIGATLSIYRIEIIINKTKALIITIFSLVVSLIFTNWALVNNYVLYAVVLVLMMGIYSLMCLIYEKIYIPRFLMDSTLFVLGLSTLLIMLLVKLMQHFTVISSLTLFITYILIAFLAAVISVTCYSIISRFRFSFILTGKSYCSKG